MILDQPLVGYRRLARTMSTDCPVTLHRRRGDYVITSCDQVLMSTDETFSERALGHLAARLLRGLRRPRVLVGGLGMGFTLRALLDGLPESAQVDVAELLRPVVTWNQTHLGHLSDHALDDPRVRLHVGDVMNLLSRRPTWNAILLDVDNGPEWMVQRRNQALYGRVGIARLLASLRRPGFVALWSVERHRPFEGRLAAMGIRVRRFRGSTHSPLIYVIDA
jgi:spermidine synthase